MSTSGTISVHATLKARMKKRAAPRAASSGGAFRQVTQICGDVARIAHRSGRPLKALDSETGMLYIYDWKPGHITADLHVLNTRVFPMESKNLSENIFERTFDGWANEIRMTRQGLPVRRQPTFTFLATHGSKFLVLYGGSARAEKEKGFMVQPLSNLLVINLDDSAKLYWWVDNIGGGYVQPRVRAKAFFLGNKLYLFGGTKRVALSRIDEPEQNHSYSIAEFVREPKQDAWQWTARDVPYPDNIPVNMILGDGVPIYGATYILFTPGRRSRCPDYEFKENSMWLFDVQDHTFHPAQTNVVTPHFPKLREYDLFILQPMSMENHQQATYASSSTVSKSRTLVAHPYASAPHSSYASRESVVICGLAKHVQPNGSKITLPEIWSFSLVTRKFLHHKISEDVLAISNMRKRQFIVDKHRMFVLGNTNAAGGHNNSQSDIDDTDYHLNSYIELPPSILSSNPLV